MNFEDNDELQQALLELHYDLLEEDQAKILRDAIASDPHVAAQWAITLQLAGELADAAKFDSPSAPKLGVALPVRGSGHPSPTPDRNGSDPESDDPILAHLIQPNDKPAVPADTTDDGLIGDSDGSGFETRRAGSAWWIRSSAIAAVAASIGMLMIGSWYASRIPNAPVSVIRLQASPATTHADSSQTAFRIRTTRVDATSSSIGGFQVTPASLSFSVLARNTVLYSGKTGTDGEGLGRIALPPDLVIPKDAKLRVTARSDGSTLVDSTIEVPLEPTRCLTYLVVDRPVYRPGESVFFRSLTLQRRGLRVNSDVPIRFELLDPSGTVVPGAFTEGVTRRGVGNGSFTIPSSAAGGPYTLVAKSLDGFFPEERCKFQVRAYRVPRIKKKLEFRKRSYGPGERVEADFSANRAEGGPIVGANVRVTATVDNKVIARQSVTTSPAGSCLVSFQLPEFIDQGAGQLSVSIDDGGTRETQSKTIPIQLGRVDIAFYPEGGYLVEGLENRVYFAARDTLGNPIDLSGEILDDSGENVVSVSTKRDGMGRFSFVPWHGERYTLKVTQPIDVSNSPMLPSVVKNLPIIDTGTGVFDALEPIDLMIRSNKEMKVLVRAVCRGQLVGEQDADIIDLETPITVPVIDDAGGVIRLTVFDASVTPAQPLVERLVYRRTVKRLDIEVIDEDSGRNHVPGEPLRLTLQVRDETGKPTAAVLGVSVVDDAALSLNDTERPSLRTHFLLTSEVEKPEDLEHANFYLGDGPDQAESLDLLLGTQGWRRFVSGSSTQPNVDFRQQLVRLLELDGNAANDAASFDNANHYAEKWSNYRRAVSLAWEQLLAETRTLMLAILFLWLVTILVHMRRQRRWGVAVWLMIASSSLILDGCGVREASMIEAPAASEVDSMTDDAGPSEMEMASSDGGGGEPTAQPPQETVVASVPTRPPSRRAERPPRASAGAEGSATSNATTISVAETDWDSDPSAIRFEHYTASVLPNAAKRISPQDLERLFSARGLDAEALADQLLNELRFPIRQYAHRHETQPEVRKDFAETLFWNPMLITDSEGRATIRFDLSDSVTSFRVKVDGHTASGRIGSGDGQVTSRLPFQIEPKIPLEVTTGDRIDLPIAVVNATDTDADIQVAVTVGDGLLSNGNRSRTVQVAANWRHREHLSLSVVGGSAEQDALIEVRGRSAGSLSDTIRRSVHIAPTGYPSRHSIAGRLTGRAKVNLKIPSQIVPGSLAVTLRAYPSPLADIMSGVDSILQEPHGCFEQASATNYPNTMALQYLRESETANPDIASRAVGMLNRGYEKLTAFECDQLGFEWFGADPGHEALSAFGLMQFTDMARFMSVSEKMLSRTRQWLLSRRDGKGGFQRNPRHLHVWSVKQEIVNAYVLWAITEADVAAGVAHRSATELDAELDTLKQVALRSDDPYLIALSASTLINVRRIDDGEQLLQRLAQRQNKDGSFQGETTVTSSGGLSLTMETTALATLAFSKNASYLAQARDAVNWMTQNRLGNAGFGSTQATVLALKALVAMAGHSDSQASGELQIHFDGTEIGQATLPPQPRSGATVEIKGLGSVLESAVESGREAELELIGSGAQNLSYTIDVVYNVVTPNSDTACPVMLKTEIKLPAAKTDPIVDADADSIIAVADGETMRVSARLKNTSEQGQPMTVAIIGLPGGVEPRVEELDELQVAGRFDYYEIRGREVVLYWRTIEPKASLDIEFHVTATIPGRYTGPASRTYLYYTAEQKHWVKPLMIEISP